MIKNFLLNLLHQVYIRYYPIDIAAMTRLQLGVFSVPYEYENLSKGDQEKYVYEANNLRQNEVLQNIFNEVIENLKENMLLSTDPQNIIYDRFSINGAKLVKERIEHYASLKPPKEEKFDPFDVV